MERTITQNGALYALQHRASNKQSYEAQLKRARARERIPPPRLDVTTASADELETEGTCFISSKLNLHLPAR